LSAPFFPTSLILANCAAPPHERCCSRRSAGTLLRLHVQIAASPPWAALRARWIRKSCGTPRPSKPWC